MDVRDPAKRHVVGGVDTHKDLHVAAVVDERDRVLGSRSFTTTRRGYRQMLAWMGSFGEVQRPLSANGKASNANPRYRGRKNGPDPRCRRTDRGAATIHRISTAPSGH